MKGDPGVDAAERRPRRRSGRQLQPTLRVRPGWPLRVVVNKDVVLPERREATVADLKLSRPPDRTPVKLTIVVTPDLEQTLDDYLLIYRATYQDEAPSVADPEPAILETFLANDRGFRARPRESSNLLASRRSPYYSAQQAADYLRLSPRTLEKYRVVGGGRLFTSSGGESSMRGGDLRVWADQIVCDSTSDPAWRDPRNQKG